MNTQRFFIRGPLPVLNDFLGKGQRFTYNKAKKHWGVTIGWDIQTQYIRPMKRVFIRFTWQEQNEKRDPDNITSIGKKFILDALVKNGIIKNDGWKNIAGWTDAWVVCADCPGVTVILEEQDE